MQLPSDLPHVSLMDGVTPLQEMPRLREALMSDGRSCPRLYIKRDDLTGLAGGGNKTRKLEYLIGDALEKGADTVITAGALQSNHARQTAAAAAKTGLAAHLILFETVGYDDPAYKTSGNLLLDNILGAEVHRQAKDADARAVFEEITAKIRTSGGTPYLIPVGGSNAIGSTAYAQVFLEIQEQAKATGIKVDSIFHANGSLGTQAGLLAGRALAKGGPKVDGVSPGHCEPDVRAYWGRPRQRRRRACGFSPSWRRIRTSNGGDGLSGRACCPHRRHFARPCLYRQSDGGDDCCDT